MKVALVCIAKMEDNYIEEWVNYHKKLGFDEIVMYENDWECKLDLPYLKKIEFPGIHKQMSAYEHFTNNFRQDYDWAAFFDCDEFLVLKKHTNVKDFLEEYDNPYGVGINWKMFGSNGQKEVGEHKNSLLKQFIMSENKPDQHVKTIMKLSSNGVMESPHHTNTPLMNTDKEYFIKEPFNNPPKDDVAQLNHYHHKSYEDWLVRCVRGQSDNCPTKKPEEWEINQYKFSDVEDLLALNFMYKI
jgi:hypothetical protein